MGYDDWGYPRAELDHLTNWDGWTFALHLLLAAAIPALVVVACWAAYRLFERLEDEVEGGFAEIALLAV